MLYAFAFVAVPTDRKEKVKSTAKTNERVISQFTDHEFGGVRVWNVCAAANGAVHARLGEGRLVEFVVAPSPVAH